jgi:DNA-binding NtrC family response regulator
MNTLIIDSKQGYGRKLKRLLEQEVGDCSAVLKCSALEALTELRNPHYDLLIIGHELPEAPIDDFIALLKGTGRKIPVLIITHDSDDEASIQDDSLESCIFKISVDSVTQMLPIIAVEAHKRCLLYRENQELKNELKKSQGNQKIMEIALNCNHKINNPLMTILGNTQLLIRDCESCENKNMARLEKIEKAAKRIQEITLSLANDLGASAEPREMLKSAK